MGGYKPTHSGVSSVEFMTQRQLDLHNSLLRLIKIELDTSIQLTIFSDSLETFITLNDNSHSFTLSFDQWISLLQIQESIQLCFDLVGKCHSQDQ